MTGGENPRGNGLLYSPSFGGYPCLKSSMFRREARGQRLRRLRVIRRTVFPLASCHLPGFYAISRRTVMKNAVEKGWTGAVRCPFCSQSPHDEAVVARCAQ